MVCLRKMGVFLVAAFLIAFVLPEPGYPQTLTLMEGLKVVTQENRLIKIKQQEEAMSEADTFLARSGLLPRVTASYGQAYTEVQPGVSLGIQTAPTAERSFYKYNLTIQQLLYDFRGISSRYEATKRILETKKLDTRRIRNGIALQFASLYFDLLEAGKLVLVAEREQERLHTHRDVARSLYEQGVITKNDLLQADVRLSDASQKLLTAGNLVRIHRSRLNNMLARPLATSLSPEEMGREIGESTGLDEAQGLAEKDRDELKIVDLMVDAVTLEARSREAEYFPRFFAAGQYDYMKNKYQVHDGAWSVLVGMNIDLLSGGSTKAELSKLMHQKTRFLTKRQQVADDIRLEVERYHLDMMNARDRIGVTKSSIGQAEENLRINQTRYTEGVGTATETVDAITLLTVAETNYYRSLYDYYRSEAGFHYATGRDLLEVYR
jgi:outer membrane protein